MPDLQVAGIFDVEEVGSSELHSVYQCSDVAVYRLRPCPKQAIGAQEQKPSPIQGTVELPDSKRARKVEIDASGRESVEGRGKKKKGEVGP